MITRMIEIAIDSVERLIRKIRELKQERQRYRDERDQWWRDRLIANGINPDALED